MFNRIKKIPWDEFFQVEHEGLTAIQIIPHKTIRNYHVEVISKAMAEFYSRRIHRWKLRGKPITYKTADRFSFEILLSPDNISFYLLVPDRLTDYFIQKLSAAWDNKPTIVRATSMPIMNPQKTKVCQLTYRKHDLFSLATDRDINAPMESLFNCVRDMKDGDQALIQILCEPMNRIHWDYDASRAWEKFQKGRMPKRLVLNPKTIVDMGGKSLMYIIESLINGLRTFFTPESTLIRMGQQKAYDAERQLMLIKGLTTGTKQKPNKDALKTWIRIASQADEPERADLTMRAIAGSYKDLSADNELIRQDIGNHQKALKLIEQRKPPLINFNYNKMSTAELGKLYQLPTAGIQEEFTQIDSIQELEVCIPEELTQDGIKYVQLGWITVRGERKPVRIPLEAFGDIPLKAVYDALCTSTFIQGKQGSGKTVLGMIWAYFMVLAGFTALLIDTADGQVLRDFINALPEDFPDEKIHALNLDNKAWPIALGWDDVYGRNFAAANGDEELAALEISERITARFIGFINSRTSTGEFTDRMKQYVISCLQAITTRKGWSFLDLELALISPSYREELIKLPEVLAMPDVIQDLKSLQTKALDEKEHSIIDPILTRLKTLSASKFMANMFYQEPKVDEHGKPVLDLRRLMDNPEGGYGHVICIQASFDAWQENQETILGFFEDKINFNAFSRIDIDQADRKPVLKWIDEPHKVIKAIEGRLSGTSVEFRKYRVKNLFSGHSIDQMGAAANSLLDGGAQITSYKTERLTEFARFSHNFKPFDDAKELYDSLPEKYKAINSVRLPSGKSCPAFIADMTPPPVKVKDRSYVWQLSAERYGRYWKEVAGTIQQRRSEYQSKDIAWRMAIEQARQAAKAAEKEAKKQEKETKKLEKEADKTTKKTPAKRKVSSKK